MYGIILRMDAGRQQRVGTDVLKKLLSAKAYEKVSARATKLNASMEYTNPFAPTLVRPSFYPNFFNATDIRTIFWKIKNLDGLHGLTRIYVDEDKRIVFEFDDVTGDVTDNLTKALESYGTFNFGDAKVSGKSISYEIRRGDYTAAEAGEGRE